ncbi:hypothetical protein [Salinimicrobium marinum]|nr:hypothetical protein [Salinimicrobium marinum]
MNHRLDDVTLEESFLNELVPEWFESVNVINDRDGVKKYGSLAEDGVIVISLKKNSWEKMTPELQNRFK